MYYALGGFLYLLIQVVYYVVRNGGLNLTQETLINLLIQSAMAAAGFLLADYLIKKKT
jgi:hypothetical protein